MTPDNPAGSGGVAVTETRVLTMACELAALLVRP